MSAPAIRVPDSVTVRLALFAVLLVAVGLAAALVGRAVGPIGEPAPAHDVHSAGAR